MIRYRRDTGFAGAMGTTKERSLGFDAVTQNLAATVLAHRRQFMSGALEAIERVGGSLLALGGGLVAAQLSVGRGTAGRQRGTRRLQHRDTPAPERVGDS